MEAANRLPFFCYIGAIPNICYVKEMIHMILYSHNESNLDALLELLIDILLEQGGTNDESNEHSLPTLQ